MSLAMYALSFAQYAVALLPSGGSEKIIALSVGTIFFILNFFGVDLMAKIQNLLVIVLLISLTMFAVFGLPSVDFGTYFSNADGLFLSDGVTGFLTATAYLGFATGGATVILGVSAECKNPTKDIPFVIVTSTVGVALTLVAAEILPKPLYIFFIVGGAMFALATTLNSQIMSATKPIMQACEDGWFPKSLAELSRYKTPWKIMLTFYIVLVVPILLDLEIAQISSLVQILGYINNLVLTTTAMKLPKMFPVPGTDSGVLCPDGDHLHRDPYQGVLHAQLDEHPTDPLQRSHHGLRILLGILPLWQRQGKAHCIL